MGIFALKRAACIPRAFNRRHGFFDLDLFSSNFPNFFFFTISFKLRGPFGTVYPLEPKYNELPQSGAVTYISDTCLLSRDTVALGFVRSYRKL